MRTLVALLLLGVPALIACDLDRVNTTLCDGVGSAEACSLCCLDAGYSAQFDFDDEDPDDADCVCIRNDPEDFDELDDD